MSTVNMKITEEQKVVKQTFIEREFYDKYSRFFLAIQSKYQRCKNKTQIKPFIDAIVWYLDDFIGTKVQVKGRNVEFGTFEEDGWSSIYEWTTGNWYDRVRVELTDEEKAQKNIELQEKEQNLWRKKCNKLGLVYNHIYMTFKHKVTGELVQWTGFTKSRNFPIRYTEIETQKKMMMTVGLFKEKYEVQEIRL